MKQKKKNNDIDIILELLDFYGVEYGVMNKEDRENSYREMENTIKSCGFFKENFSSYDVQSFFDMKNSNMKYMKDNRHIIVSFNDRQARPVFNIQNGTFLSAYLERKLNQRKNMVCKTA